MQELNDSGEEDPRALQGSLENQWTMSEAPPYEELELPAHWQDVLKRFSGLF